MSLNLTRRKLLGVITVGSVLQGCGGGGGGVVKSEPVPGAPEKLSLRSLSVSTLYFAHRGGALVYPEHTYEAFDGVVSKSPLLECDVQTLRDGALALMHDLTVDRTTTSSGKVSEFSTTEWRQLKVDADDWHGSHFGNGLQSVLFADWVARYKDKAILVPEDKDGRSTAAMIAVFNAQGVDKGQVLIQSFFLTALRPALDAGYETCYLDSGQGSPAGPVSAGVKWVGIDARATDADTKKWLASGLKVIVWTVDRRFMRDAKLALGVHGFFSDDPEYLSGNTPLSTTDRFEAQTWMPGMSANAVENGGRLSRGRFLGADYWGYDTSAPGYLGCLQGYLSPIRKSSTGQMSVEINITFDAADQGNEGRWASVFISKDDRPFIDRNEASAGHHVLFRKNGVIEVYRKAAGSFSVLVSGVGGTPIADGAEVRFRITCSSTGVVVSRLQADRTIATTLATNDASVNADYLHLGRSGLACRFRKLIVT